MKKPFILGINGSSHKNGHVAAMLSLVLKEAGRFGARTKLINLSSYKILPHRGTLDSKNYIERTSDDTPMLQRLVLKADGLVFASPTHWFTTSSIMKLFIDRLTSLEHFNYLLEGKSAGFITYGPQGGALNNAMLLMAITNHWGMISPPYSCVFDEGRKDPWVKKDCQLLGKNIVQLVNVLRSGKVNWDYKGSKYRQTPIEQLK